LREDYSKFTDAGASIVAIAPDDADGVAKFTRTNTFPFPLLADSAHVVFDAYDVASTLMSLGQRPALFVIDGTGVVRFDSIGKQQWEIPSNENVLAVLQGL
jgi:thioredoxin-dependent peroxiredoxin